MFGVNEDKPEDREFPYLTLVEDYEQRAVEFDRRAGVYRAQGYEQAALNCEKKAAKKRAKAAEWRKTGLDFL